MTNLGGGEEVGEKAIADANPVLEEKEHCTNRSFRKSRLQKSNLTKSHLTGKVKRQQSWWPLGKAQETQASPSITSSSPFLLSRVSWSSQTGEWVPQTSVPGQDEGKTAGREFWVNRYLQPGI